MYRHLLAHLFSHLSRISGFSVIRFVGGILIATGLSGCGNKGALYVPEDAAISYRLQADQIQDSQIQDTQIRAYQLHANQNKD
jgi:predicted small lipoprotein YifL